MEVVPFKAAFVLSFFWCFQDYWVCATGSRGQLCVSSGTGRCTVFTRSNVLEIEEFQNWSNRERDLSGAKEMLRWIVISCESCPSLFRHMKPEAGCLFVHSDGNYLTRDQFAAVMKKTLAHLGLSLTNFETRSCRTAWEIFSPQRVQAMRVWKSDCYRTYVCTYQWW